MSSPTQVQKLRGPAHDARTTDNVSAVLNPLAEAVGNTPIMGAPPPAWVRPSLLADFTQVTTLQLTSYHRDALGYVWLRIALSTAAGALAQAQLFELPLGYRPDGDMAAPGLNGTTGAANAIIVEQSGEVRTGAALAAGESVVAYFPFLAVQ